jgi:hypothetical protein
VRSNLKKTSQKRAGRVAKCVGSEFKLQYHQKKKKRERERERERNVLFVTEKEVFFDGTGV